MRYEVLKLSILFLINFEVVGIELLRNHVKRSYLKTPCCSGFAIPNPDNEGLQPWLGTR